MKAVTKKEKDEKKDEKPEKELTDVGFLAKSLIEAQEQEQLSPQTKERLQKIIKAEDDWRKDFLDVERGQLNELNKISASFAQLNKTVTELKGVFEAYLKKKKLF